MESYSFSLEQSPAGLSVIQEFYADRAYKRDKMLASRKVPGSIIHDASRVDEQLRRLLESGEILSIDGEKIPMEFDSICVHGDTEGALDLIKTIRSTLKEYGIEMNPMRYLR